MGGWVHGWAGAWMDRWWMVSGFKNSCKEKQMETRIIEWMETWNMEWAEIKGPLGGPIDKSQNEWTTERMCGPKTQFNQWENGHTVGCWD